MCIKLYGKKRYEDIRYAYGATLVVLRGSGEGCVKCTGKKKRYATFEWPIYIPTHSAVSFYILRNIVNLQ